MYYGMSSSSLQKMYVEDSLTNEDGGFSFQIKNRIESGRVSGLVKLEVDGEEVPLDEVTFAMGDEVRKAEEITRSNSVYVRYGAVMTIKAPGELEPGEHEIALTVYAPEIGNLTLPVKARV
jgi:hypothetical protein